MKKVFVENLYSTNLITLEDHQEIIGLEDGILTSMKNKLTDTIVGLQKKISTRILATTFFQKIVPTIYTD